MVTFTGTMISKEKRSKRKTCRSVASIPTSRKLRSEASASTSLGIDEIPPSYSADCIHRLGPQLLQGIDRLTRVLNGTNVIEDDHSQFSALHDPFLPTHILALCDQSPSDTSHTRPIILQPTHRTVLASQCTNLPELSDELSFSPAYPVVYAIPLHLPYPTVFEPLHRYLYDHDGTKLLRFFLPLEWRLRRPQNADIERRHWDSLKHSPSSLVTLLRTRKALISGFSRLLAFKQNVTALGIHDKNLWRVMSTASYLLRSALDSFISS